MATNPKQRIEDLFARYGNGSNYIRVAQDGSDYLVTIVGSYSKRGRYKIRRFDENGNLIYQGFNQGTRGQFQIPDNIGNLYKTTFNGGFTTRGLDKSPISNAPEVPTPPAPPAPLPDAGTGPITSDYNVNSGYGEIDLRAALREITGQSLPEINDDIGNAGKVKLDNGAIIDDDTITRSGAIEAHAAGYRGQGIVVAVIDTGLADHSDLDDNLWVNTGEIPGNGIDDDGNGYIDDINGWNTVDNNNDLSDIQGHGTHVAGIIAAEDNGIGKIGVAPDVKIMVLKPFRRDAEGNVGAPLTATDEAIYYAVNNGADVINLSLGGSSDFVTPGRLAALKYAEDNGVICVIASGNDANIRPGTPAVAAADLGIAVGAVDDNGNIAGFTNRAGGPRDLLGDGDANVMYVTANGVSVYAADSNDLDGVISKQGTSMACPVVAGAVAVMLSADPTLSPDQIKVILANTSYDSYGQDRGF